MREIPKASSGHNWRPSLATSRPLLAGLLVTAGLPPYPWTGLLVVAGLVLLFATLRSADRPGRCAWLFGLAHQTSLLYWLFLLDPAKSIPSRALVPVQAALAIVYVSVFYLGFGWAWGRLRGRLGQGPALLLVPVLWTVMEHLRAGGEMGFPWCLSGGAVLDTPLFPLVRAAGELGVGTALAFTALPVIILWPGIREGLPRLVRGLALAGTVVVWSLLVVGALVTPAPPPPLAVPGTAPAPLRSQPLSVAAVQANVALADKWVDAKIDSTKLPYAALTARAAEAGAEFVVWAETALPAYVRYDPALLDWTRQVVSTAGVNLYTGFPDAERSPEGVLTRYNSSGLFSTGGHLRARYPKHHLLPIGEAMPFTSVLPFLAQLDVGQAEWTPGPRPVPMTIATPEGGFPFSGLICFESAFAWLARSAVVDGARCLVVITNDGWFGESAGPRQHAALARIRAAECDVPLIRCANNGISLISDRRGRVVDSLGLGRRGYVAAAVTPGPAATPFVRWGNQPLFAFLVVWTVLVVVFGRAGEPGKEIR